VSHSWPARSETSRYEASSPADRVAIAAGRIVIANGRVDIAGVSVPISAVTFAIGSAGRPSLLSVTRLQLPGRGCSCPARDRG
jgi:hypothetical protein